MDDKTEALTRDGWKAHHEMRVGDEVLTLDPCTKDISWQPTLSVYTVQVATEVVQWSNTHGFNVLTAPEHEWVAAHRDRDGNSGLAAPAHFRPTGELSASNKQLITGGGIPRAFAARSRFDDALVELVGWVITEGHYQKQSAKTGVLVAQSSTANPAKVERIRRIKKHFADRGATATENPNAGNGMINFYFGAGIGNVIREIAPDKQMPPSFLTALTHSQAELLYQTILDGDGHRTTPRSHDGFNRTVRTENFIQKDQGRIDGYQMLAAMLGKRTCAKPHSVHSGIFNTVTYVSALTTARHLKDDRVPYRGLLWCPRTETRTWLARRSGGTFWTGELPHRDDVKGKSASRLQVSGQPVAVAPRPRSDNPGPCASETTSAELAGVDAETEALTPAGWRTHSQLAPGDYILTLDPQHKRIRWSKLRTVWRHDWDSSLQGPLTRWNHRAVDALTTPGHWWLELNDHGRKTGEDRPHALRTTRDLQGRSWARIVFGSGTPACFADAPLDLDLATTAIQGDWVSPKRICGLTITQARDLYEALISSDGKPHPGGGDYWQQRDQERIDSFQMLCAMLGWRTAAKTFQSLAGRPRVTVYTRDNGTSGSTHPAPDHYDGLVWRPDLEAAEAWCARRRGTTYWTGSPPNSSTA
ncbi:hypothetical protein [Streptomyces sp. TBY4]|uniref:hypothetical protein n=1 Tax=Streptomyces sp. TBY4 TaxID=2962030 RepID=UPI0020B89DB6|nr:hypothetical protein [Streptomyces sp. TBY4]MCP3754385.1 hypothetical protein [Streptomyces sp. TBY4]